MRVVRGGPGSGKTEQVYGEFAEAVRRGAPKPRLVLPTATLVRHSQHELARRGLVFSPHSVLSLSRFARERASAAMGGKADRGPVPDGLLRAFVREALRRVALPDFRRVAGTEGMAGVVIDTIHLLENAGATTDSLGAARGLSPLARAFLKVWIAVDEAVRRSGFMTRGGLFRAAAECRESATVWMDGFLHLSPLESGLVRALAPVCEVTMTLGTGEASDEMYRLCLELRARTEMLAARERAVRTVVVESATADREVDDIARRIAGLQRDGVALRGIAVAVRDTGTYVPLLRAAFERFGLPARFYFGQALRHHPVEAFLGGLMDGALQEWDFEATLGALRAHPLLRATAEFDRFDFEVREKMPAIGAAQLLEAAGEGWLRGEIEECLRIGAWRSARLRPAEWARRLVKMAERFYRPARMEPGSTRTEEARSHGAALGAWKGAVETAAAFWPDGEVLVSLEEFRHVAKEAVEAAMIHPPDDRTNVVHVMGVQEARQWNVHTLIVCGMSDRDFPRKAAENAIFSASDIPALQRAEIPVQRTDREQEERWLFGELRTRAAANLILTVAAHDAAGRGAEKSRYLHELEAESEAAGICVPAAREERASTGAAGRIESPKLLGRMAELHRTVTPTTLEKLLQCPFQFFAARALRLEAAPERPHERLQSRVTGTILHAALEKWLSPPKRDFVEVFDETWEEECRKRHLPPGYRLEAERYVLREIARKVGATERWKADGREVEVDFELAFPRGIVVNGRIDRVDLFGDECVVIDYKSSKTENVKKLVASDTNLQGPLYVLAARQKLQREPVAMAFWAVRDDKLHGWGTIPGYAGGGLQEMPDDWAEKARELAAGRLEAYLEGDTAVRPHSDESCKYCDFAAACRVETLRRGVAAGAGHE